MRSLIVDVLQKLAQDQEVSAEVSGAFCAMCQLLLLGDIEKASWIGRQTCHNAPLVRHGERWDNESQNQKRADSEVLLSGEARLRLLVKFSGHNGNKLRKPSSRLPNGYHQPVGHTREGFLVLSTLCCIRLARRIDLCSSQGELYAF